MNGMDSFTRLGRHPAFRTGASVAVATGLYGISFGALGVAAGLDVWQTIALSALMFTGGSQFAFVGVLPAGAGAPRPRVPPACSGSATPSTGSSSTP
jgi:predicted branched-subunit amino acid permease